MRSSNHLFFSEITSYGLEKTLKRKADSFFVDLFYVALFISNIDVIFI